MRAFEGVWTWCGPFKGAQRDAVTGNVTGNITGTLDRDVPPMSDI